MRSRVDIQSGIGRAQARSSSGPKCILLVLASACARARLPGLHGTTRRPSEGHRTASLGGLACCLSYVVPKVGRYAFGKGSMTFPSSIAALLDPLRTQRGPAPPVTHTHTPRTANEEGEKGTKRQADGKTHLNHVTRADGIVLMTKSIPELDAMATQLQNSSKTMPCHAHWKRQRLDDNGDPQRPGCGRTFDVSAHCGSWASLSVSTGTERG